MSNQGTPSDATNAATVEWRRRSGAAVASPLVRRVPSLECKLEHPDLEPTGFGQGFFPDAVPYRLAGSERVFYWRSALTEDADAADDWRAVWATTDALAGVATVPAAAPPLTQEHDGGVSLVVDGTIAGDTTTVDVRSYDHPAIELVAVSDDGIEIEVEGRTARVPAGQRRRVTLAERVVTPVEGEPTTTEPELVVRYPGRRELHHPAPEACYRLFPSFGLDLDAVSNPVSVPTVAGELDHAALADGLGVDLAERPYPERVLWQAFAYATFDPHADRTPELVQLPTGHVVLTNPSSDGE